MAAGGKRGSPPSQGALHELKRGVNTDELDLKIWAVWSRNTDRGGQFLRAMASDSVGFLGPVVCGCNMIQRARPFIVPSALDPALSVPGSCSDVMCRRMA